MICCGPNNEHCPDNAPVPNDCTPGCAVALHEFTSACGGTVRLVDNANSWFEGIMAFEQSCLDSADPLFFLNAIKNAQSTSHAAATATPQASAASPEVHVGRLR